jgi:hypothetical protein
VAYPLKEKEECENSAIFRCARPALPFPIDVLLEGWPNAARPIAILRRHRGKLTCPKEDNQRQGSNERIKFAEVNV